MVRKMVSAALALFLLGSVSMAADDAVTLKWEFQKDKTFYEDMKTTTKQTIKVAGMDITQNSSHTFVFSLTPKEQDSAKNWIIVQKLIAVKMDIEIGGNTTSYDSTKPDASNVLGEFFKALVDSEFKLTISPDLKVVKVEGRDDFVKKLTKATPQMEAVLTQILGDEAIKQMADPAFAAIPTTPVKKGQTWTKDLSLNMGPIGSFKTNNTYTYEGKDGKLDKIKIDTKLAYTPPSAQAVAALPFKIKSATLNSKNASGAVLFDNDKHRMDSSTNKLTLEGKMTVDIGGQETALDLVQDQTTTVKFSDTNPVASATPAAPTPAPKKP